MTLILETVGTPDEETMARVASEKVRNSSGRLSIMLIPVIGSFILEDFANIRKERFEEYIP